MLTLTTREAELEQALRDLLPLADAFIEHHYDFVCTHGLMEGSDTCICDEEAKHKTAIERARKLLEQQEQKWPLHPITPVLNRLCPHCHTRYARDCGYLEYNGEEYDCSAPDIDTVNPSAMCDNCPHVWCTQCRQENKT